MIVDPWAILLLLAAVAAALWLRAEAISRDDRWDRMKLRRMWWVFDEDGRRVVAYRAGAFLLTSGAIVGAAWRYTWLVLVVVGVVAGIWILRRQRLVPRRVETEWDPVYDGKGREVIVYAFGALDHFTGRCLLVKLGHTARDVVKRLAEITDKEHQVARIVLLAVGPGGEAREQLLHTRHARDRAPASEWFRASPEVFATVQTLGSLTDVGRRIVTDGLLEEAA